MPLHQKRENIPVWSKRSSLFLRKSFWSLKKNKLEILGVDISGAGSLIFFWEPRVYKYLFKGCLDNLGGFFLIWHNFCEGSVSIDRNIRIFPCVCSKRFSVLLHKSLLFEKKKKRRFVDNIHGIGFLGSFENREYICFRTSLADPVI